MALVVLALWAAAPLVLNSLAQLNRNHQEFLPGPLSTAEEIPLSELRSEAGTPLKH